MIHAKPQRGTGSETAVDALNETRLVKRFLKGDERAFDLVVKRHEGTVRSIVYRLVGNADDAEDLSQETFIRVYGHLGEFKGRSSLKTWILRIATNLARDLLRRRRRKPPAVPLEEGDARNLAGAPGKSPLAELSLKEKAKAMASALEELPFKQRAALTMKVVADMNYGEIAKVLGTTRNSIKSNIHLARRRLAAVLGL